MTPSAQEVAAAVSGPRVLHRLEVLAGFNATPGEGVTRIAFSDEEAAATECVAGWMREAGLTVTFDRFGSMFGSTDGNAPGARVSMAGSHLDTVPHGGTLDGALGVVAALEAVLAMQAMGVPLDPLEVVVWRCEEPVRFSQGKAGSLVFTGQVAPEDLRPIEDPPFDLEAALRRAPARPLRAARPIASCLELHIEQGRVLERAGEMIGVVTAIAAPIRLRVEFHGRADHSGATPMDERRDALCAAAELVLAVEQIGRQEAGHRTVATAANLTCRPGTLNVVPGEAVVSIDIRGIDRESMELAERGIIDAAGQIGERRGIDVRHAVLSRGEPTVFHPWVVDCLSETVRSLGLATRTMPSGAGHDVQCLAGQAAAGMLFIPSVGGLSHCPEEFSRPEDVVAGTRALAACWWAMHDETLEAKESRRP
jgi:beta-ureidopropionase / N-carbamoyl-L-amino-acid hydrolase